MQREHEQTLERFASSPPTTVVRGRLGDAIARLSLDDTLRAFRRQGEFLYLESWLDEAVVRTLEEEFECVRHLTYYSRILPWIRCGGSIGYRDIRQSCPNVVEVYKSAAFIDLLSRLVDKQLFVKSERDDHSCSFYVYTQPGDWTSWHYDTCGCEENASYTVLIGILDRSTQLLQCQLHKNDPNRATELLNVSMTPGSTAIFCGSKVYHGVSRLGRDEERVVLSLSYATEPQLKYRRRFVENMKDALLHFGPRAAFQRNYD